MLFEPQKFTTFSFPSIYAENYSLEYFKAPILRPNYLTVVFKTVIRILSLSVNSAEMRKVHPLQYVLCLASLITKCGLLMEIHPL